MTEKTVLLMVDVQRAFFDGDKIPAVFDSDRILKNVKSVLERARESHTPIVYVQHAGGSGHPLEEGGKGWNIHPAVAPIERDAVVGKRTPDSFHNTDLKKELDLLGVSKLIILGNQTDFCIDTTCRRAFSLGYNVTLITDAHSTWDSEHLTAQQIIDHHTYVLGRQFVSLESTESLVFSNA